MSEAATGPGHGRESSRRSDVPRRFDVCNGDADGLCAVLQWRLSMPAESILVTGLKRDIALLDRVRALPGDEVLVCDVSMHRNRDALARLLAQGVRVRYFDHHARGDVGDHPLLEAHVDPDSAVCTSILVDRYLGGRHRAWAAVGAYGDNLGTVAESLACGIGLKPDQRAILRRLGEAINYNAYGDDERDVLIAPARLYRMLARYADPLRFAELEPVAAQIAAQRDADLLRAAAEPVSHAGASGTVRLLPDAPWSRRVIGAFANELAGAEPSRAHAVLRPAGNGRYVASVRAPLRSPAGAGLLCARFGGSGRAAAGGIDSLREDELDRFVREFASMRWGLED